MYSEVLPSATDNVPYRTLTLAVLKLKVGHFLASQLPGRPFNSLPVQARASVHLTRTQTTTTTKTETSTTNNSSTKEIIIPNIRNISLFGEGTFISEETASVLTSLHQKCRQLAGLQVAGEQSARESNPRESNPSSPSATESPSPSQSL